MAFPRQSHDIRKEQYDKEYWSSTYLRHKSGLGGRIVWDAENYKASYSEPIDNIPGLSTMWNRYAQGARSRGVKPDYFTFKKYYDQLDMERQRKLMTTLNSATAQGIPLDKIQEAVADSPYLRKRILEGYNKAEDPNVQGLWSRFIPERKTTLGEFTTRHEGKLILGGLGGAGAAAYMFGRDDAKIAESKKILREYQKANPKPKAVDFQTKKGAWKKGGKVNYGTALKDYKSNISSLKADIKTSGARPIDKWLKPSGRKITSAGNILKTGALFVGPTVAEKGLETFTNLSEKEREKVGDFLTYGIGAGYTAKTVTEGYRAVNAIKGAKTLPKITAALKKAGMVGKVLTAAFLLYNAFQRKSGSTAPVYPAGPTQTEPFQEETLKYTIS